MSVIYAILAMFGGFIVIGTVAAVCIDHRPDEHTDEPEELPRVVISQQVPSVFDTFKGGKK